jgi:hypothetical protein
MAAPVSVVGCSAIEASVRLILIAGCVAMSSSELFFLFIGTFLEGRMCFVCLLPFRPRFHYLYGVNTANV